MFKHFRVPWWLKVAVGAHSFHQLKGYFVCICSPRYCITCDKWLLSPLMLNFYLSLYLTPLSMLSLLLNWSSHRHSNTQSCRPVFKLFLSFLSYSKNVTIRFARRTDVMPPVPFETKHHPSSVDILLIKRLIAETSKQTLLQFLQHEFVNIGKSLAERLIGKKFVDIAWELFFVFSSHSSWSSFPFPLFAFYWVCSGGISYLIMLRLIASLTLFFLIFYYLQSSQNDALWYLMKEM